MVWWHAAGMMVRPRQIGEYWWENCISVEHPCTPWSPDQFLIIRSILTRQDSNTSMVEKGFGFCKAMSPVVYVKMAHLGVLSAVSPFDFYFCFFCIYIGAVSIWVFITSLMSICLSKSVPQMNLICARESWKKIQMWETAEHASHGICIE